uniref:TATA box-binding protein-like 1 n=2 Tax=Mesocestoides corti TaxID=53468 RepID=A0A5K3EVF8_MESCO
MYGASSACESPLNGHSLNSLDFLDSIPVTGEDQSTVEVKEPVAPEGQNEDPSSDEVPSMTLTITNVVCMANMRCHLRLKELARSSVNVEYKALQNHVIMRLRKPYTVATIWSSGKIWCTGANSLSKARQGARRIARRISQVGFPCRFSNYRIVNIMATCRLPFRVRLEELVKVRPRLMSYEPELAPGLNFKAEHDSSTSLKLFSTGRVVIMGSSLENIGNLVEELVPLAALHQTDEPLSDSDDDDFPVPGGRGFDGDKNIASASQRRQYRRRRMAVRRRNPFAEIAAHNIPALADAFLSHEADLDDVLFDAFEEEDDAACTDNDSEEETDDSPVTSHQYPAQVSQAAWQSPIPTAQVRGDVVRSGSTKRACITAYSEQPSTPSPQPSTSSTAASLPTAQPQFIFATAPNVPTTTVVPIRFATAPVNGIVHHPQPQFATFAAQPSAPNSQTKVVTINPPSGQANIVRIVSPVQFATTSGPQQPRFILNRLPVNATIINPSAIVMAPSGVPAGGVQFATSVANGQPHVIATANNLQNIPNTSTFVAPGYR